MVFSGIWSGICRCGRPATIIGLASWMPACEVCEFVHRAEPVRLPQYHYEAELAVQPTVLPPTAVSSGTLQNAYAWTQPVYATAPMPEDFVVWSGGGMCRVYRPQPEPVFVSGGIVHQMMPEPFWQPFRAGQPYC